MDNAELEARVAHLETVVAAIQARLAMDAAAPIEAAVAEESPREDWLRRAGASVLIVGGAYVLRALTELAVITDITGVFLGLAYALFWIWRGRTVVAAGIAGALIWEATARFEILNAPAACALLLLVVVALLLRAIHLQRDVDAWLALGMTVVTCTGIAIVTKELLPPMLAVAVTGLIVSRLRLDLPSAATGLLTVASTMLGLGGAMLLARSTTVIAACFIFAVMALAVVLAKSPHDIGLAASGAIALALGTFATLQTLPLAIVWALIACAAARIPSPAIRVQAALWSVAAALAAHVPIALLVVCALSLLTLKWTSRDAFAARVTLLFVITATAFFAASWSPLVSPALTRTFLIALGIVVLYAISPRMPEAKLVGRVLLIIGGLKLIAEDLRTSPALLIVVALAMYGGALTFAASRRSSRGDVTPDMGASARIG